MGSIDIERGVWSGVKTVDCFAAQDHRLLPESRAMLWYLLSKPEGWSMSMEDVVNEFGWGAWKWRTVRDNLARLGYLEGRIVQGRGYVWTFRSRPSPDWRPGTFPIEGAVLRTSGDPTFEPPEGIEGNQIPETGIPDTNRIRN